MTRPASASPLAAACAAAMFLIGGCTTYNQTQPPRTATEQLILAHAAEMAADKLAAALPTGSRAFIDDTHLKGDTADYAVAAIRAACLKHGLILATAKPDSDITVEVRMGALSIDEKDVLFGLPPLSVPLPGTLTAFSTPELSVFSETSRKGVAEFAAIAYDTKTGHPIAVINPVGGERDLLQRKFLTVLIFGSRVEGPGEINGSKKDRSLRFSQ
jgi:hypothetical protein